MSFEPDSRPLMMIEMVRMHKITNFEFIGEGFLIILSFSSTENSKIHGSF